MTNQTNTTTLTTIKGVKVATANDAIASAIRNINAVTLFQQGKGLVSANLGRSDGFKIVFSTEEGASKEGFVEPNQDGMGFEILYFLSDAPFTEEEITLISIASEAAINTSGKDIGTLISDINKIAVIDETNVSELNNIITIIEELMASETNSIRPYATMNIDAELDHINILATSDINIATFLSDGYNVSDQNFEVSSVDSEETLNKLDDIATSIDNNDELVDIQQEEEETTVPEVEAVEDSVEEETTVPEVEAVEDSVEEETTVPEVEAVEDSVEESSPEKNDTFVVSGGSNFNALSLIFKNAKELSSIEEVENFFDENVTVDGASLVSPSPVEISDLIVFCNSLGFPIPELVKKGSAKYGSFYKLRNREVAIDASSRTATGKSIVLACAVAIFEKSNTTCFDMENSMIKSAVEEIYSARNEEIPTTSSSFSDNATPAKEVAPSVEEKVAVPEQPTTIASETVQNTSTEAPVVSTETTPVAPAPVATATAPVVTQQAVQNVLPTALDATESMALLKVLTTLKTLGLAERKISVINRNVDALDKTLRDFAKLNSDSNAIVVNLISAASSLYSKKESFSDDVFEFTLSNASLIANIWLDAFTAKQPSMAQNITKLLANFETEKAAELGGRTYSIEELKAERPLFFDDEWVLPLLKKYNVSDKSAQNILSRRIEKREFLLENYRDDIMNVEPKFRYVGSDDIIQRMSDNVRKQMHTLINGDTGCGKTTLVESMSCLFNLPLYTISGNASTSIESLVGFRTLEDGEIEVVDGRLVRAMEVGGIFYPDETNFIKPQVMSVIYPAADHRRKIFVDFTSMTVSAQKDFVLIGSYNAGYEGTSSLNEALKSRTVGMHLSSMSVNELKEFLITLDPELESTTLNKLAAMYVGLTNPSEAVELPASAKSTRHIINTLKSISDGGVTMTQALRNMLDNYNEEEAVVIMGCLGSLATTLNINASDILSY